MEYKRISDLSFLSEDQKKFFKHYVMYEDGTIFNEKTDSAVEKTLHGNRGYVANLSVHVGGFRWQRQITIHRALADLFIGPIKDGEKLIFLDGDKTNLDLKNIVYRMTKTQQSIEYGKCLMEMKGITEEGRICNSCDSFVTWDLIAGPPEKKLSICKKCVSKRGIKYQKEVGYANMNVPFETYADRLVGDSVVDIDGFLGVNCSVCGEKFLLTRSKVLNRIKSLSKNYNVHPLLCDECAEKEK